MLWGTKEEGARGGMPHPVRAGPHPAGGSDVTIVGISTGAVEALKAAEELAQQGISAEVIDPRTLVPLDIETIIRSVQRTGRLVVADPAPHVQRGGRDLGARRRGGL